MTTSWYPLDRDEMRTLFDLIAGTLDFGSSFFDSDDVMLLRKLAQALDLDPMEGTPEEDRRRIVHAFRPGRLRPEACHWCGKGEGDQVHGGEA